MGYSEGGEWEYGMFGTENSYLLMVHSMDNYEHSLEGSSSTPSGSADESPTFTELNDDSHSSTYRAYEKGFLDPSGHLP